MADISRYIRLIQIAARGEEVRDAIVDSLNGMNNSIPGSVESALNEAKESGDFDGPQGPHYTPAVSEEGVLSWSNNGSLPNPSSVNLKGLKGDTGDTGATGPYFTPAVSEEGVLSWTNNGSLTNPQSVSIKGQKGDTGDTGATGATGPYFTPSVNAEGVLSWTNNGGLINPTSVNIKGPKGNTGAQGPIGDTGDQGPKGDKGDVGPYYMPYVSAGGVISWSNNGGRPNPSSVNIKGPKGEKGDQGPQGNAGTDGISPSVTVTDITGGHRVTIIDADHPSGHSFDVMDGYSGMQASLYDPNGAVAQAGGIAAYVDANAQGSLVFDNVPVQGSANPVKSGGIYSALQGKQDDLTGVQTVSSLLSSDYLFIERNGVIYKIRAAALIVPDNDTDGLTSEDGDVILTENGEELLVDTESQEFADAAMTESGDSLLTETNEVIRVDQ